MSGCPWTSGQVYQFLNDRTVRLKTAEKGMSENKTKSIADYAVAKECKKQKRKEPEGREEQKLL